MKRLAALAIALVVACAGFLVLSGCTPKASESDITAVAFMQKDQVGNQLFTMEIVENDSNAQLTITGPALQDANINASLDRKSYASIQKSLSKLSFDSWTPLVEGQVIEAPAGGFAMVVQRRDGTVLGSSSDTLSVEAVDLVSDQISGVITDFVLDRLGIDLGILGYFM